ncbi:MAG: alanine--tRNA ligase, partial [Syntrophobacteraceae bacterium]
SVTPEELSRIECLANDEIRENHSLQVHTMDIEDALKTGAMALFEEKYGDRVRMIEIPGFSRELCGGTHTHKTGDIGMLVIVQETSIASGVRRIEALGGRHALEFINHQREILNKTAALLKSSPSEVAERVEKILSRERHLEKELETLKASLASRRSAD